MTQWSNYTPYNTSYMPSDVDEVDSTGLKVARALSVIVIAVSAWLLVPPLILPGLVALMLH